MSVSAVSFGIVFDLARPEDDDDLRALLRETPMGGWIHVAFLREPSFFHASEIQGTQVQVFVARVGGRVVGVSTRAIRSTWVNGRCVSGGYLGDLRVHPKHRGGTILGRGARFFRELHQDGLVEIYSTVIVDDNRVALDTMTSHRAGLPRYTDMGRILTPLLYLKRPLPPIDADIVRATPADLPAIVRKLNEPRMQLAPAYREDDFARMRDLRIEDFYLLRRQGRLAGVMAVWNQHRFRQTVAVGYSGILGVLRPAINLFRKPPLPTPGRPIRFYYIAFVSTDDVEAYRALLRRAYNDHVYSGASHLIPGLHERDPRCSAFEEYARMPFAGRLFAVTLDDPPNLDDRLPYVEAALL